jgi:predicted nucleic acid-binding Zn ribbon protein
MPETPTPAPARPDAVQTAVVPSCEICGGDIQGGRMTTCSDRCRSERWRRQKGQRHQNRDARIAAMLREAVQILEEGTR